jgi:hypothetical protein
MCADRERRGGSKSEHTRTERSEVKRSFEKLLSLQRAADLLRISPETLRRMAPQGKVSAVTKRRT